MHSLASKATRGPPELQDCPGRKDGLETQGPRASLVSLVFQGRKGLGVSKDSWATLDPLGMWVTGAPKDPKETKDSQALLAPWDLQAFQASPRRSPPSLGPWVPRAGEVFPAHRERWGLRVLQEIQVSVGLQARLGPRAEEVCLLFRGSGETKDPWDSRAQSARKGSQAVQGAQAFQGCQAAVSASATSW